MILLWLLFSALLFLIATFSCFYLPGRFFSYLLRLKFDAIEDIVFPLLLGIVSFTLTVYFLSWAKLFWLIVPLILYIDFIVLIKNKWNIQPIKKKDIPLIATLFLFAIFFSLTTILSGDFGNIIRLIGTHKVDSLWHLSLINELKVNFPPSYPNLSGVPLKAYHFFYDFLLAKISNIFLISPSFLYFQFFPILMSLLWVFGVYILMIKWSDKKDVSIWAVFLTLFGGSFGFLMPLYGHLGYSLDDVFGITQPASSLINPPFAISIVLVIGYLLALKNYLKKKEAGWIVPIVLFAGVVSMFKVYAGIVLVGGFLFLSIFEILHRKKIFIIGILGVGLLFTATYWVFAGGAGKLIYAPFWAPHKILQDHFPWYGYDEKIYTFSRLHVIRGIIQTELYGLEVFILGSLGTRLVGLVLLVFVFIKNRKLPSYFSMNIFFLCIISLVIPLFFIQSIQPFDIIQMAWYFLFFSSLFASFGFAEFFRLRFSKLLKILFVVLIVISTLPSAYEKYSIYFSFLNSSSNTAYYTHDYIEAFTFLKNQGAYKEITLEVPTKDVEPEAKSINSWYVKNSHLSFLAFGNKRGYYTAGFINTNEVNLSDKKNMLLKIVTLANTKDGTGIYPEFQKELGEEFKKSKIRFIIGFYPLNYLTDISGIRLVYHNPSIFIYQKS